MESENVQFMRRVVQPRFDNVAAALGALRHLRTGHQAFGTNVGAIEAAVKLLADRTAAIVIALKGHPDQVRRQKTIGAWKDIVRARELQRTEPLAEASAPPIYRLPLALLQKIGESLETQLLDETAEVLRAFEKIARCTAGLLWVVNEHNIGGALKAMRTRLDEIQGILDFATSLMRQVMPPPWDPDIEKREAQRRWALQTDPSSSSSSSWLLGDLSDADSSRGTGNETRVAEDSVSLPEAQLVKAKSDREYSEQQRLLLHAELETVALLEAAFQRGDFRPAPASKEKYVPVKSDAPKSEIETCPPKRSRRATTL